ncbi:MAG: glycosyltransferase [Vicinamibacterales bacterium]
MRPCSRRVQAEPPGPPYRLLHVASLNAVKNQATLIRAVAALRARGTDVHLAIVGEDTLGGTLQQLAQQLNVAESITFHGFLPSADLVALHHAAHLFVLTSRHEAAGVVVLEAAACGVPVIGSSVGYIADWAGDRSVAVPPGDPHALADAIDALLRSPEQRARMSARAAAWARCTRCRLDRFAYRHALSRRRPGREDQAVGNRR